MSTAAITRQSARPTGVSAWLPLVALPAIAWQLRGDLPAWQFMWLLAIAIYAGLKWLTFADYATSHRVPVGRSLGYLLAWPGMDAAAFFGNADVPRPRVCEWLGAGVKTAAGLMLMFLIVPLLIAPWPWLAAWVGMVGIALALHFGLLHGLSLLWRCAGVDARPIMNAPALADSLTDFWSRRWNLAFRDLAHRWVFRPLVGRSGIAAATMAVFVVSGVIHDLVISLSAGGGLGLPTLYFTLQGAALLLERSRAGKTIGLGRGIIGRAFAVLVALAPVGLLFHTAFIERVVLPMLVHVTLV